MAGGRRRELRDGPARSLRRGRAYRCLRAEQVTGGGGRGCGGDRRRSRAGPSTPSVLARSTGPAPLPTVRRGRAADVRARATRLTALASPATTVCRCEGIPRSDIDGFLQANRHADTVDAVKLSCRTGMGPCQVGYCETTVAGCGRRGARGDGRRRRSLRRSAARQAGVPADVRRSPRRGLIAVGARWAPTTASADPQILAEDLPGARLRDHLDELDLSHLLVRGHMGRDVHHDRIRAEVGIRLPHDESLRHTPGRLRRGRRSRRPSAMAGCSSSTASNTAGATWYPLVLDELLEPVDDAIDAVGG